MLGVIVLAAGAGRRMQGQGNKMFIPLGEKSVLQWTLSVVKQVEGLSQLVLVYAAGEEEQVRQDVAKELDLSGPYQEEVTLGKGESAHLISISYVEGGAERQDSVARGLEALADEVDVLLVHDGARPLATVDIFERTAQAAQMYGAAVAAVKTTDTVKRVGSDGYVLETLKRQELYNMQTPQGFKKSLFQRAVEAAKREHFVGTDDVSLVERLGAPVRIVEGSYTNIKLTTPNDIAVAKRYLGIEEGYMRVGMGYDIHQLQEGRPCILCGVQLESPLGPAGHSDADVPVHALMDAMLGAAGLRDIGYYFPPEDDAFKGISSMLLLEKVKSLLKEQGLKAYNIDIMVISETPKLKPYIDEMKENLRGALDIPLTRISIKATTNESLGAIGRREGIAAQAIVTLVEGE